MKRIVSIFVLLIPIMSFAQLKGQARADSLVSVLSRMKDDSTKVNTLNELAYTYKNLNAAVAITTATKALRLSEKLNWNDGIAKSYSRLGSIYFKKLNYEKANAYYESVLKSTQNPKIICRTLIDLAHIYTGQSNYTKGLGYANRALAMCESIGDEEGKALAYSCIGVIYSNLLEYKKAIGFLKKALDINQRKKIYLESGNDFYWLGNCYALLKQYELAETYYLKSIEINTMLGQRFNKMICIGELIDVYFNDKKYDKALDYANELLRLEKESNSSFQFSYCMGMAGRIYIEKAKLEKNPGIRNSYLEKATRYNNESVIADKKLGNTKEIADDYAQISEAQAMQGHFAEALKSFHLSVVYKDSVYNSDNKETIKNLEDKRSIELRDKEIKFNKLALETKEKQKWYMIFGLLLLTIIGSLFFYQSHIRKISNQKLSHLNLELDKANKVKTRLLGILNHDLRSPVNSFIHFMQFQKESPEMLDEVSKDRIENATITSAKNLLDSMENILLWTKDQMENFEPQPENIQIQLIFDDIKKHFSAEKTTIIFENSENLNLFTDVNYLKTVLRNLTANAIKALEQTENGRIILSAGKTNTGKYIAVIDNGPGATDDQFRVLYDDKEMVGIKTGLGLHLIRDLVKAIDCGISVAAKSGEGTTITLTFK